MAATDKYGDCSQTVTNGNRSYIPITQWRRPSQVVPEILKLISDFETVHRVCVTNFTIEKQQNGYNTRDYTYGIWLTHEPVETEQKK